MKLQFGGGTMSKTTVEEHPVGNKPAREDVPFTTISGRKVEPLYRPADVSALDYARDLGDPGDFPFTRGVHKTMYRGKPWTMRQFAGFGSAAQTNERFKYLLGHGSHGLSVAFDLPTLMGRDPDHPLSLGEVGKCGVAVTSLADMEILFEGIPLDKVSTSMTINSPAAMLLAMYVAVAEKQGVSPDKLTGSCSRILKEFIARGVHLPAAAEHAVSGHGPLLHGQHAEVNSISISETTSGTGRPRCRNWPSRCATGSSMCSMASTRGWMWTTSRRGCRSSSTRTAISSRRSPSSAPRAGSGRAR